MAYRPTITNTTERTANPQEGRTNPLSTRDFVLLVAGLGISLFANLMLRFAMSMWVFDETGSAAAFVSILTANILPTILPSHLGGVVTNRTNHRTVMVARDALSHEHVGQIAYGSYSTFPAGTVLATTFELAIAILPLVARTARRL